MFNYILTAPYFFLGRYCLANVFDLALLLHLGYSLLNYSLLSKIAHTPSNEVAFKVSIEKSCLYLDLMNFLRLCVNSCF